ncbi:MULTISPECIES: V-type ATP synthase subunit D [Peptoniphilus]|uniref:V-type ATP synthase subunit D n=2 Tax=Peptoniphilus lacrimalis TaxID=33031 RepID=D1VSR7_9FIRM|nr:MULTISPECIES: V-type ATP synthase subunit D [Peptoniphilus]KGF33937.1 ATP synthase subunit D [Peptoniphilus lacrimalis DNF00528]EFA90396.1 V-type ATPase, D subunit [Peptoniphilus lacrimalis 315-B]EFK39630.1 V-type ATPase, D subunit [Peptoniphilus sp. oral taxon 836 str. F0141]MDK7721748.1 V-type ATP synthase subunit D [Peptoniphilus lacrimalis]MDK7731350.1 V-type ATP synthase subunit D [Peptoniphilus lacrimalis]
MTILKVNPTRMTQTTLKKRLLTATRGHKLLKDKQDELMRQFIDLIKENKKLRVEVEKELHDCFSDFLMASALMSPEMLEESIVLPSIKTMVKISKENVMSVEIPKMEFIVEKTSQHARKYPYGYIMTTSDLDSAIDKLKTVMDRLLLLAQKEKASQLMADEIEKTRRRVNALEYKTIPDLKDTIKYIRAKLDESERANITRLMKVKDIISKEEEKEPVKYDKVDFNFDTL